MSMDVFACFELNFVDAPILRGLKTYAKAIAWRDANLSDRFIVGFCVDRDPEVVLPENLFQWAAQQHA